MSDTARGLVLLVALLLWSPVLPGLMDGSRGVADAALLFGAALLLAWGGVAALHRLVRTYSPQGGPTSLDQETGRESAPAGRRADDGSTPPGRRRATDGR